MIREVLFFLMGVFIREIINWAAEGQKKRPKKKMEMPTVETSLTPTSEFVSGSSIFEDKKRSL